MIDERLGSVNAIQTAYFIGFRPVKLAEPDVFGHQCTWCGAKGEYIPSAIAHSDGCRVDAVLKNEQGALGQNLNADLRFLADGRVLKWDCGRWVDRTETEPPWNPVKWPTEDEPTS